jgi:anaerobic selenocysteine-containing dehydrogenase
MEASVHHRTCPFCEATCGLEVTTRGDEVVSIRGDADDVLSHGFICPKAFGLKQLHEDPDRLTTPLVRRDGELVEATWDEAFKEIDRRLSPILAEHGRNAVAAYVGNPNAHNLSALVYLPALIRALGSQNLFSAATVDQMPKQVSAGLMFGTMLSVPVPDVDRTDHLLILGANPLVSNGSLLTAPDMRGRLRAIRERGGKVVVVDPRRTRTADEADEHHFIRPGSDALLLASLACTLVEEDLVDPGQLGEHLNGLDEVLELVRGFRPEDVAAVCGIPAGEIRRMARELAGARSAAVYARIGTCTQEFGTLASWLVDVLNVLTGNLDREGGAMFPLAAAAQRNASGPDGTGKGVRLGRWHSRVRGLAEVYGELPVACMAEEMETPGEGQVRALVTIAGNPVVSTPNAGRLERAIEGLDFVLAVDIYVNETTRHADVILPAPEPLQKSHYDLALYQLEEAPHGIDLGPHRPRIPSVLRTPSGKVELAPEPIAADVERLHAALERDLDGGMVLIGRRQLRSNNSWMHNLPALVKGKDRCTLHVHPGDADRLGLADGARALVSSATGEIEVPVEVTDAIMPGVVSIPHGWGHDTPGVRLRVASDHAGVNSNVLADETQVDPLSGNAVLNGIPVDVAPVTASAPAAARPLQIG